MSYKIVITKLGTEMHKERDFVGQDSSLANDGAYHVYEVEKESEQIVYSQRVDSINLKGVIDAVNEQTDGEPA